MPNVFTENLNFPSGRSVKRLKQDAKAFSKNNRVPLHEALDEVAQNNGMDCGWSRAIASIQKNGTSLTNTLNTDLNPYRKLLVLGLNQLISEGLLTLDWDGKSGETTRYIETNIAGRSAIVSWFDIGFGEVRISVWWDYNHSRHPQANKEGSYKEKFLTPSPLAKRQHYPKFVGAVCSGWFERENGKYLQGKGQAHITERYARRGELEILKEIPNPQPLGYNVEGKFHM